MFFMVLEELPAENSPPVRLPRGKFPLAKIPRGKVPRIYQCIFYTSFIKNEA